MSSEQEYLRDTIVMLKECKSGELLGFLTTCFEVRVIRTGNDDEWEVIGLIGSYKVGDKISSRTLAGEYPYPLA